MYGDLDSLKRMDCLNRIESLDIWAVWIVWNVWIVWTDWSVWRSGQSGMFKQNWVSWHLFKETGVSGELDSLQCLISSTWESVREEYQGPKLDNVPFQFWDQKSYWWCGAQPAICRAQPAIWCYRIIESALVPFEIWILIFHLNSEIKKLLVVHGSAGYLV